MRWLPILLLLASGCFSQAPDDPVDIGPTPPAPPGPALIPAPQEEALPGLYDLSSDGLRPVDAIPGLTWITSEGVTKYVQDVRELLLENGDPLILVQALEEQVVTFSYDVDAAYRPEGLVGDPRGSDFICMGTSIMHDRAENAFYYERAAGREGEPPGNESGGGTGHARAGSTTALDEAFGPRFAESGMTTFRVEGFGFVRLSNFLSQYPPDEMRRDGNQWFQNYTLPGAHRIIRIPPAPIFCAHGFAEFDGVQVVGDPPFQVARDGRLAIPTLYGASMMVDSSPYGPNPNPANSAAVTYLGQQCAAGAGKVVVQHSFDAGVIEATVSQWSGVVPNLILMGMGRGQEMFSDRGWARESCPS